MAFAVICVPKAKGWLWLDRYHQSEANDAQAVLEQLAGALQRPECEPAT